MKLTTGGSHFYLALYWAQALAQQDKNPDLKAAFTPLAQQLGEKEAAIAAELTAAQGHPVDVGGYYFPDGEKTSQGYATQPYLKHNPSSLHGLTKMTALLGAWHRPAHRPKSDRPH
jgi:monomeric isocitrate dehydrogenase